MQDEWRIFCWAAMHSADFWQCYIIFPISFRLRKSYQCEALVWALEFRWRKGFSCYTPWSVKGAYHKAQGNYEFNVFDDIPF